LSHRSSACRSGIADPQHDEQFAALAWLEGQIGLQGTASIIAVGLTVGAVPLLDRQWIMIAAVWAKKSVTAGVVAGQLLSDRCHPGMVGAIRDRELV
jgi:hypothetical protein